MQSDIDKKIGHPIDQDEERWLRRIHRVSGVGLFAFLALHIINIWLVGFGPEPFNTLAIFYRHPAARILHVFLFFGVLFHAVNGLRLIILDFWPGLWRFRRGSVWAAAVIFLLTFVPSALLILMDCFLPS